MSLVSFVAISSAPSTCACGAVAWLGLDGTCWKPSGGGGRGGSLAAVGQNDIGAGSSGLASVPAGVHKRQIPLSQLTTVLMNPNCQRSSKLSRQGFTTKHMIHLSTQVTAQALNDLLKLLPTNSGHDVTLQWLHTLLLLSKAALITDVKTTWSNRRVLARKNQHCSKGFSQVRVI